MSYLFGRHPVLEALKAERPIHKLYLSKTAEQHSLIAQILHLARARHIPLVKAPVGVLDRMVPGGTQRVNHQGIVAEVKTRGYASLDDLFAIAASREEPPFFLLLDQLTDPHNLGAILRSGDAAGVHGVIIPKRRSVGLTETVGKTSAGAVEHVAVVQVPNLANTMRTLKDRGIWIYGIDLAGTRRYNEIDFQGSVALVVGAEGSGLSRVVREHCDGLMTIPMRGKIASLNASVAASLVLYGVYQQRRGEDFRSQK